MNVLGKLVGVVKAPFRVIGKALATDKEEIAREIGISAVVDTAMRAINGKVEEAVNKTFAESRGELFGFILHELAGYDPVASDNLMRRHRLREQCAPLPYDRKRRYKPGEENRFVQLLTKLKVALSGPDEKTKLLEVFKRLGHMKNKEFDHALPFLHHDVVIQFIKRAWVGVQDLYEGIVGFARDPEVRRQFRRVRRTVGRADQAVAQFVRSAEPHLRQLEGWFDRQGWR